MTTLIINGTTRSFDGDLDLNQLLECLSLAGKKLAIERNGELVLRSQYAGCEIADGDRLEIVMAVGGG